MGKKAVTPEIKQRIIGLYLGGFNNSEIARTLKSVSRSCASRTIQKFKVSGSTADKKRSGRPRKTNQTNDNYIYRIARKNPKYSTKDIAQEINVTLKNHISRSTVNRRLIDRRLCSYVAARKPMLKPTDRIKRMNFCRKILSMSTAQL